jgi:hypothetical protein
MDQTSGYLLKRETSGYQLPATVKVTDLEGAQRIQVFRTDAEDLVLAQFTDVDTAALRAPEAEKLLLLKGIPSLAKIAHERSADRRWWPTTLFARAERTIAIIGILLAFVNYGAMFLGSPNISVRAPTEVNVEAGGPADFAVTVFNRADTEVRINADTAFPATVTPPTFALESRKDQQVEIRTSNPITSSTEVVLHMRARAGWFRGTFESLTSTRLIPWRSVDYLPSELIRVFENGQSAEVQMPVLVGKAADKGLSCDATLTGVPGVVVDGAKPSINMERPRVNAEPGNELAFLGWQMSATSAFTTVHTFVYLRSKTSLTPEAWRVVIANLSLDCRRIP